MKPRPMACSCCGMGRGKGLVDYVPVVRRHPDTDPVKVESLALCDTCRTSSTRAWRLRWKLA
jgi:hypothetical protein